MGTNAGLKFPNALEFTPNQIDLREVLRIAARHNGDGTAIVEAIRKRYYAAGASARKTKSEREQQQRQRSRNVLIGMGPNGYRLFDLKTNELTQVGRRLLAMKSDARMYREFARHILRECEGVTLLQAVRAIQARGERTTMSNLSSELRSYGFDMPTNTPRHRMMLAWLRQGGVVDEEDRIDETVVTSLLGSSLNAIDEWNALPTEQKAFLRTLRSEAEVHGESFVSASEVKDKCIAEHGRIFSEGRFRAQIIDPLVEGGWLRATGKGPGRGGKIGSVAATPKLIGLDPDLAGREREWGIPADLRPRLNTPLKRIREDLEVADKNVKGIALELLAVRIASDLALIPVKLRERSAETGGAEVDLIAEGAHLHFSRWLFQCKNVAGHVGLSALAKEVGMAVLLRAHVIVIVTTGSFARTVQDYARKLSESNYLQVVLVDTKVLNRYAEGGAKALMAFFHSEASRTLMRKRPQAKGEPETLR